MEYITVRVSDIELEVMPLHELPGLKVLRVLSAPPDMERLRNSVDLFRLALRNMEDWNGKVKYFTLEELMKLIDQWMDKSQELKNKNDAEQEWLEHLKEEEEYYSAPPEDYEPEPEPESEPEEYLFNQEERIKNAKDFFQNEFFVEWMKFITENKDFLDKRDESNGEEKDFGF